MLEQVNKTATFGVKYYAVHRIIVPSFTNIKNQPTYLTVYTDLSCYIYTEYQVNHCCTHRNRCPSLCPDTDSNPQDMGRQQDQKYHPQ